MISFEDIYNSLLYFIMYEGGGEIAQWLASLSVKPAVQVRTRHDLLVADRCNATRMLSTCSHQCRQLVQQRPSKCYHVCVIMHVKDP